MKNCCVDFYSWMVAFVHHYVQLYSYIVTSSYIAILLLVIVTSLCGAGKLPSSITTYSYLATSLHYCPNSSNRMYSCAATLLHHYSRSSNRTYSCAATLLHHYYSHSSNRTYSYVATLLQHYPQLCCFIVTPSNTAVVLTRHSTAVQLHHCSGGSSKYLSVEQSCPLEN